MMRGAGEGVEQMVVSVVGDSSPVASLNFKSNSFTPSSSNSS